MSVLSNQTLCSVILVFSMTCFMTESLVTIVLVVVLPVRHNSAHFAGLDRVQHVGMRVQPRIPGSWLACWWKRPTAGWIRLCLILDRVLSHSALIYLWDVTIC